MKITVDRTTDKEGNLVFVITCKEPKCSYINALDVEAIKSLQMAVDYIYAKNQGVNLQDVGECIYRAKEVFFEKAKRLISMGIKNDLEPKYKAMVQEIYNWTIDSQEDHIKNWMTSFDAERTKYYFDNDRTVENTPDEDEERFSRDDEI